MREANLVRLSLLISPDTHSQEFSMFVLKSIVAIATLTTATYAVACPKNDAKHAEAEVQTMSVDKAAALHEQGKVIMVDANGKATRQKIGVVPGARLLTSYNKFDMKELKASKEDTLVFYCYNEMCSAAPRAAETARAKGFKTRVMDAGIIGWKKAGKPIATLESTNS